MTLTTDDRQWIKGAITEGIVDALNEIVIPRFEAIESRLDSIESRLTSLERDMRDVKERLGYVEGEIQALTNDI